MGYRVVRSKNGVNFYGRNLEAWKSFSHELVLSGPYETGKTRTLLTKMHGLCVTIPRIRALMTRKTYASLKQSAVVTYEDKVLGKPCHELGIKKLGENSPYLYIYPNGSKLHIIGFDKPNKILSTEWDFAYFNQLEEADQRDWEQLVSRCTGRSGNSPWVQVMGDANPGPAHHWILKRPTITRIDSRHRDNPFLFDQELQEWTPQGQRSISILKSLTGNRYKRGYLGLWTSDEGVVYKEFDEDTHVVDEIPFDLRYAYKGIAIDFGVVNPTVVQWFAVHKGQVYLYRELYVTGIDTNELLDGDQSTGRIGLVEWLKRENISVIVCDHDKNATSIISNRLRKERISTKLVPAYKAVDSGIEAVRVRLRNNTFKIYRHYALYQDPQLKSVFHPCSVVEEFGAYCWKELKDEPVKKFDHALDALRYFICHIDNIRKGIRKVARSRPR